MQRREEITVNAAFLAAMLLLAAALTFPASRAIAAPITGGALLYLFAKPFVSFCKRLRLPTLVSVAVFYLIIVALLFSVLWFVLPLTIEAVNAVSELLPASIRDYAASQNFFGGLLDGGGSVARGAGEIFVAVLLSFYFLRDDEKICAAMSNLLPKGYRKCAAELFKSVRELIYSFFRGQLILCVLLSILEFIMLFSFRIPYALPLALLSGFCDIVPYFGATIGFIPIATVTFLFAREKIIWVSAFFVVIQLIEGSLLAPRISSDSVGLHPATVIIALLVGSAFAAFWGILLCVPFTALSLVAIRRIFRAVV